MATTVESAPQAPDQQITPDVIYDEPAPEGVVIDVDTLQHNAGFDTSGPVTEKLTRFESLAQNELANSESKIVAIIAGNAALTLAAAIEAVDAGAEEIQLIHNGKSVVYGPEGNIVGAEGAGTIEISLGSHTSLPGQIEVVPVNFNNQGVDKDALTPVSMANSSSINVVPDDPSKVPDIRFTGQIGELSEYSIVHFDSNDPMLGVVGGAIRWAVLRKKGLIKGSVEVFSGGGPRHYNRVFGGSTDELAKVHIGDVAYYGGGD